MPPSWNAPPHVAAYIVMRLRRECEPRGMVRRVADAIGVEPPTISNTKNQELDQAKVSMPLAQSLARYWDTTYDDMERAALEAAEQAPPVTQVRHLGRRLRERPEWSDSARQARVVLESEIPADVLDRLLLKSGEFDDDEPGDVTPVWVVKWIALQYERTKSGSSFRAVPAASPVSEVFSKHSKKKGSGG